MKILKRNIKYELSYMYFMKIPLFLLFAIIAVFCINQNNLISSFNSAYTIFKSTVAEVEANGDDPQFFLDKDYEVKEIMQEDGRIITQIDNIVRYDYEQLKIQYNNIQPSNSFIEVLKTSSLVLLPIIVGVFAIYFATFDFSQNTLKTRSLLGNSIAIYFSKLIATIIVFTAVFATAILLGYLILAIWSHFLLGSIDLPFGIDVTQSNSTIQLLAVVSNTYFISFIYLLVTFSLGILFKRTATPLFIFLIYHLMIPNLGQFDFKNIIMNIYNLTFHGNSEAIIANFSILSVPVILSLSVAYIAFFLSASFIRFKEMSKYSL